MEYIFTTSRDILVLRDEYCHCAPNSLLLRGQASQRCTDHLAYCWSRCLRASRLQASVADRTRFLSGWMLFYKRDLTWYFPLLLGCLGRKDTRTDVSLGRWISHPRCTAFGQCCCYAGIVLSGFLTYVWFHFLTYVIELRISVFIK